MTIPHDYYIKFTHPDVMDDTLSFHCKGNFFLHESIQHATTLHHLSVSDLITLTGNELELYPDSKSATADYHIEHIPSTHALHRNESCEKFSHENISIASLQNILSPLVSRNIHSYKRGYPSGGALYPIELFCCNLNPDYPWPKKQNTLHLLPRSRKLEPIKNCPSTDLLHAALLPTDSNIGTPSIALIYVMYLPKALFKYRYRGYRLGILEAGSMYMLTDLRCKELKVNNRLWSGYTDHQVTKSLNLNPALFLPLCVQF